MNPEFVRNLKKILGLPEKNGLPPKPPHSPRILANVGRYVYDLSKRIPEKEESDAVSSQPWTMPPLCDLYFPNDPKKQCLCIYFRQADLPDNFCQKEILALVNEHFDDYVLRQAAFKVEFSGKRPIGDDWIYENGLDKNQEFYAFIPPEKQAEAIADEIRLSPDGWDDKWGAHNWNLKGRNMTYLANIRGFNNLLPELKKMASFLEPIVYDALHKVLSNRNNFTVYRKNGITGVWVDIAQPEVVALNEIKDDYFYFSDEQWESGEAWENGYQGVARPTVLRAYSEKLPPEHLRESGISYFKGDFAVYPIETNLLNHNPEKWLNELSQCVSVLAVAQGFQAACPDDPRVPDELRNATPQTIQLMTSDNEPIEFTREDDNWLILWKNTKTRVQIIGGEVQFQAA